MTRKAWKPCGRPGCNALVRGGRYCKTHAAKIEHRRGTAHQRGYTQAWSEFRDAFIDDHCHDCGIHTNESEWPLELHHKDGLGPNGPRGRDPSNLETLCKPCHTRKTSQGAHR